MQPKKTLRERELELQALLPTPSGLAQLQELASRYAAEAGWASGQHGSLITYILVYERQRGLIVNGPD